MIERHWKGLSKTNKAEEYLQHLKNDTFKKLEKIDGFISASILRRELDEGIEFLVVTKWEDLEVIRQFAGEDITRAVVPLTVQDMLKTYDRTVRHYELKYPHS